MSAIIQYDLFKPIPTETETLRADIEAVDLSLNKVRKGTYAEINRLKKENLELKMRLEIIERNICQK